METNTNNGLELNNESLSSLEEIRRWANFLSIVGFIAIGIILLAGLTVGQLLNKYGGPLTSMMPAGAISFLYFLIAAVYFFPVLFLYRFSVKMKVAIHQNSSESLTFAFENLKSVFRFLGIFTIIILSLYLIVIITAVIFGMISRF